MVPDKPLLPGTEQEVNNQPSAPPLEQTIGHSVSHSDKEPPQIQRLTATQLKVKQTGHKIGTGELLNAHQNVAQL